jgi:hypothetical protein
MAFAPAAAIAVRSYRSRFATVGLGCLAVVCASSSVAACAASRGGAGQSLADNRVGPILEISRGCTGQNAEAEEAVDHSYVYETWIGCGGIGFARSDNRGRSFGRPLTVPGSQGSGYYADRLPKFGWDPAVAVAPDGTLYVSYMIERHGYAHPMVAVSVNHGASFSRVSASMPPNRNNWGDRDFIAVAPTGALYLTWDYGQSLATRYPNTVFQKSTDGGKTWSHLVPVSPGFPSHGGGVAAPLVVAPGGRIDVLFWTLGGDGITHPKLPGNHIYFTSSTDGGKSWSKAVAVQPGAGSIGPLVTWIDTALGMDTGGTLYATWDTQQPGGDIGWISYSTDNGRTWSPARRVTPDHDNAEHIMAVVGGPRPGTAYVGWLSDNAPQGFAQYVRAFSVRTGWLSAPVRVSREYGNRQVWPGDTIGIALLGHRGPAGQRLMLSWGSAIGTQIAQIWAAQVTL